MDGMVDILEGGALSFSESSSWHPKVDGMVDWITKIGRCVGKKKHLARRLIATHQSTPCAPLSDVA